MVRAEIRFFYNLGLGIRGTCSARYPKYGYTRIADTGVPNACHPPARADRSPSYPLARETGRTKTTLAREAILEYIDDLEDYHLAEARARKNRKTIPLEDVEKALGLAP